MTHQYFLPTKAIFGFGSLGRLGELISESKARKVLLVAGNHLKKDGTVKKLQTGLEKKLLVYKKKISSSTVETIDELADYCRQEKPDLIIGIGGGTVIDTAKSAAILANHSGSVKDYVLKKKNIKSAAVFLIIVPTTAGTGSEVTPWATVWDSENKKKYSLSSTLMFPRVAIVDPKLTLSLPPKITASAGMDALTQAIEGYWSRHHNLVSDVFSLEAIRIILTCLEKVVNHPSKNLRKMMAQGSLFSGLAFSNTKTTICHAVSYPMTAYWGIAHGQAVAITLPTFIRYSLPFLKKERRKKLLLALKATNEENAAKKITQLMKRIGLATKLSQLGINKGDLGLIVKEGFHPGRAGNAPKIPSAQELHDLLIEII